MKTWITLLLVAVIAILLTIAYFMAQPIIPPKYKLDDVIDTLKTGDIVLFSSKNNGDALQSSIYFARTKLVGSEYGHVGIILREKDDVYLVECCNPNQVGHESSYHLNNKLLGGVRIIRLQTILKQYYDMYGGFFAIKPIKTAIPNKVMRSALQKYQDSIFEDIGFVYCIAMIDNLISKDVAKKVISKYRSELFEHNRMTCGEFVCKLLIDCEVVRQCRSKLIWPHVYTGKRFDKLSNGSYDVHYKISC